MFLVNPQHPFNAAHHFFHAGAGVIAQPGNPGRYVLRKKTEVFHGFENAAFHQIVVREAGLGTAETRVVRAGFARLAVPQNAVATGAGHWATAANLIEQATAAFAEAAVHFL